VREEELPYSRKRHHSCDSVFRTPLSDSKKNTWNNESRLQINTSCTNNILKMTMINKRNDIK